MTRIEIRANKRAIVNLGKASPTNLRKIYFHMARNPIFTHETFHRARIIKEAKFIARILKEGSK